MLEDPIIEELHKIRAEIAAESNYDMHAIVVALRQRQKAENRIVVTLPPKRVSVPDADLVVEADALPPPLTFPPLQAQGQPLLETVIEERR